MKKFILFILFFVTTACSYVDSTKIAPGYTQAFLAIKNVIKGYENTEITPELIELVLSINKQDMFLYEEMEKRLIHKIKAKI